MPFIYILHADCPLSHSQHYAGSTDDLATRMATHAAGHGAAFTRALRDNKITWHVGALGHVTKNAQKRVERALKDSHNLSRFCETCCKASNVVPARIPETTPYDVGLLRLEAPTKALKPSIRIRAATSDDVPAILALSRRDKDSLGFLPMGGKEGIQHLIPLHQVKIAIDLASEARTVAGYVLFTISRPPAILVNIHQTCTHDAYRFLGIGRAMVNMVQAALPFHPISAKVRSDLPAMAFWEKIGFVPKSRFIHKTSGKEITQFFRSAPSAPAATQPTIE